MNKRYQGPIRQIEFDEGMGIDEETTGPVGNHRAGGRGHDETFDRRAADPLVTGESRGH